MLCKKMGIRSSGWIAAGKGVPFKHVQAIPHALTKSSEAQYSMPTETSEFGPVHTDLCPAVSSRLCTHMQLGLRPLRQTSGILVHQYDGTSTRRRSDCHNLREQDQVRSMREKRVRRANREFDSLELHSRKGMSRTPCHVSFSRLRLRLLEYWKVGKAGF